MTRLKYAYVFLMLLTILTVAIASTKGISAQRPTPAAVGLPTWEYKIVSGPRIVSVEAQANSLSEQGFELVEFNVTPIEGSSDGTYHGTYHMLFRRQKH